MTRHFRRLLGLSVGTGALLAAFWAGSASAEGDALDRAHAQVTEALQALQGAPARGDAAKFDTHRKKAVTLLTRAQGEILKAKRLQAEK